MLFGIADSNTYIDYFVILLVIPLRTITIRLNEELERKMSFIEINWSEYIMEVIREMKEIRCPSI